MSATNFLPVINELIDLSSLAIMPHFCRADLRVESKSDASPVTVADCTAEQVMREAITKYFPSHGIVGEEFGNTQTDSEYVWYLDPIDGTKSFIRGCPLFGTLIGLTYRGTPILGAISHPALSISCIGDGRETYLNGQLIKMRPLNGIQEATLLTSDLLMIARYQEAEGFESLLKKVELFRTWGDCYGYTLLASGFCDIMLDPIMNPWDLLPLIPIIEGAGGVITSWQGGDAKIADSCVAAGAGIHQQVLSILAGE